MESFALPSGKTKLAAVLKAAGDVVQTDDVIKALSLSRTQASKLLSRWASQGWLRRVGKGIYYPVNITLLDAEQVVEDPWVLVPPLFDPSYIGGRTAAEFWDLTEQIFRDIVVFTTQPVRKHEVEQQNMIYVLKHTSENMIFGTKTVWRGQTKIAVSDIHRTIIDMMDDPALGGGIQHVADCLEQYLRNSECDPAKLIEYAARLGNGAVFKRLGFLAERLPQGQELAGLCSGHLTKGNAKLDPAYECPRLATRWRLRLPESWYGASA
jgi:predicted transcriptional regulator of viral defense system